MTRTRGIPGVLPATVSPESQLAHEGLASPINTVRMIVRAARRYQDDPAYVQSLRLLVKEQHHHTQTLAKLADHLGVVPRPRRWWESLRAALLGLPGVRFELSVLLLNDLIQTQLVSRVEQAIGHAETLGSVPLPLREGSGEGSSDSPADLKIKNTVARQTCDLILHDKRAHAIFFAERLTLELADLNFLRRNLRRLRLRLMFAVMLTATLATRRHLLAATGASRRRFALDALRQFQPLLESVVPYHRAPLVAALLAQRERPYEKPRVV